MERYEKQTNSAFWLLVDVVVMYAVSGILLLLIALGMYHLNLQTKTAEALIILVYIAAGLTGGLLIGHRSSTRRFLWGLAAGSIYFLILVTISLAIGQGKINDMVQLFLAMILCLASAMAGGMIVTARSH